jgi:hypothetical protein
MSATSRALCGVSAGYRGPGASGVDDRADRHLEAAADALHMAVLSIEGGQGDDPPGEKEWRAARAREHLAEAVTALSRARVHVAGIRTYALPAVMSTQPAADQEIARLHQLSTWLLWHNHRYLPPRSQGEPLSAEEERQLDLVYRGLRRQARIARVTRYPWLVAGAACLALAPWLGPALGALGAGFVGLFAWRSARDALGG